MRETGPLPQRAIALVAKSGVLLESARGPAPSLAAAIAGEAIRGSWWTHPKAPAIFLATRAVRDSPDVLVCRLLGGKITYVHRRLWPAVVRLADAIGPRRLDAIREEHTEAGAHRLVTIPFPDWVPDDVITASERLAEAEARSLCSVCLAPTEISRKSRTSATPKRTDRRKRRAR